MVSGEIAECPFRGKPPTSDMPYYGKTDDSGLEESSKSDDPNRQRDLTHEPQKGCAELDCRLNVRFTDFEFSS